MDENKMHLINKIFNNETIRTVWNKEEEKQVELKENDKKKLK